jgi:hypothetical protein
MTTTTMTRRLRANKWLAKRHSAPARRTSWCSIRPLCAQCGRPPGTFATARVRSPPPRNSNYYACAHTWMSPTVFCFFYNLKKNVFLRLSFLRTIIDVSRLPLTSRVPSNLREGCTVLTIENKFPGVFICQQPNYPTIDVFIKSIAQ